MIVINDGVGTYKGPVVTGSSAKDNTLARTSAAPT